MKRTTVGVVCALAVAGAFSWSSVAVAEVLGGGVTGGSSGGVFELLATPPSNVGPDVFDSPNLIAFDERQDVLVDPTLLLGPSVSIPAGSVVSSHYVVFDPEVGSTIEGFVLFDEPIVAIIGGAAPLDASANLFGAPGTNYTTSGAIGPEVPDPDMVLVDPGNPSRLLFRAAAISPGDHVRVLTGVLVPEPTAALLLGGLSLCVAVVRPGVDWV